MISFTKRKICYFIIKLIEKIILSARISFWLNSSANYFPSHQLWQTNVNRSFTNKWNIRRVRIGIVASLLLNWIIFKSISGLLYWNSYCWYSYSLRFWLYRRACKYMEHFKFFKCICFVILIHCVYSPQIKKRVNYYIGT